MTELVLDRIYNIKLLQKKRKSVYIDGLIFITNGGSADLIVVAAKTDQSAGAKGISLVLLDTKMQKVLAKENHLKNLTKMIL